MAPPTINYLVPLYREADVAPASVKALMAYVGAFALGVLTYNALERPLGTLVHRRPSPAGQPAGATSSN
jgi:hypothetical protein